MQVGKIALCFCPISPLRRENSDTSEIVSQVLFGEIISILEVKENWIKIETWSDGYHGFCDPKQFKIITEKEAKRWLCNDYAYVAERELEIDSNFGKLNIPRGAIFPGDFEERISISDLWFERKTIVTEVEEIPYQTALAYLNSPYLWGGKTPFGIDCSGLTQQVFRFHDYKLPRDASQQVSEGIQIDFKDRAPNDLAFFVNKEGKVIHVGILSENNQIIHASGRVRIDILKETGIWNSENESYSHYLSEIRRVV